MKKFLRNYTILFSLFALAVFSFFLINGKTFIWRSDGFAQQIRSLIYYAQWMRTVLRNIFIRHTFVIPQWEFALGEGNDIFSAMHFYAIGDPFNLLSVFVPIRWMHYYFDFMVIARIYCAGLIFSALCREFGQRDETAILAGAMTYDFCFWTIMFSGRHPYFLTMLVFFPMLILGIEKVLKGKNPFVLTVAVFLSAVNQVYLFCVMVCMVGIYTLVRCAFLFGGDFHQTGKRILTIVLYALLGVIMAGVIVAPMLSILLTDDRMSAKVSVPVFYSLSYYAKLPGAFINAYKDEDSWLCLGFAAPALPTLFQLFRKRRAHRCLFFFTILTIAVICSPFCGHVLNAFSYVSNRWSFAAALLFSYILVVFWNDLIHQENRILLIPLVVWAVLCGILPDSRQFNTFINLGFALLFLEIRRLSIQQKKKSWVGILILFLSVFTNAHTYFTGHGTTEQQKFRAYFYNSLFTNETEEITTTAKQRENDSFFRYSGTDLTNNAGLLRHFSSTNYAWSLTNPNISRFIVEMEANEPSWHIAYGYDGRASLLSLSSVLYYTMRNGGTIPYGFTLHPESSYTYKNPNWLPIGYAYDSVISEENWEKLSTPEKQEVMLHSAYLSGTQKDWQEKAFIPETRTIPYEIIYGEGVEQRGNDWIVTEENAEITLIFDGLSDSETYFSVNGMDFSVLPEEQTLIKKLFRDDPVSVSLSLDSADGVRKMISYNTSNNIYYADRHDFLVNLGYGEANHSPVRLRFSHRGVYYFDQISITCQPMDKFADRIEKLKAAALADERIETNRVSGTVRIKAPSIFCLAIPYSKGWSAEVDGKKAELLQANIKYMALELEPGEHSIVLTYKMPLFREGICLSCGGFAIFAALLIGTKKRKRTK